jgi:SWI/SNF-related matrix-associated actin-dependent regulator of chromatin subfamily A member 5
MPRGRKPKPRIRLHSPIDDDVLIPSLPPVSSIQKSTTRKPRTTASSLLRAFNAKPSPTSTTRAHKQPVDMNRALRVTRHVNYTASDDSEDASSAPASSFNSPMKPGKAESEEEEELSVDELAEDQIMSENRDVGGREMRPRSALKGRAAHGIYYERTKKFKRNVKHVKHVKKAVDFNQTRTDRAQIRHEIATVTKLKQDQFLRTHKDLFLPLLPDGSYISKLPDDSSESKFPFSEYDETLAQPAGVKAVMKPYQLRGLAFLVHLYNNGMSGILGDEMGLGKTLQTLSLFQYLREQESKSLSSESRPFLVVAPLSVIGNWVSEAQKFTPGLKVLRFHGPSSERAHLKDLALGRHNDSRTVKNSSTLKSDVKGGNYDLIVTTYETYLSEAGWFKRAFVWKYLVLDEGHKIKNHKSDISKALQGLKAEYRLLLTGTPLQNDLMEVWSLFHWLLPDVFNKKTSDLFGASFDIGRGKVNRKVLSDAREILRVIMLRRKKDGDGVNLNLPEKKEVRLYIPLTPIQRKLYTQLLTRETDHTILEDVFRNTQGQEQAVLEAKPNQSSILNGTGTPDISMVLDDEGGTTTPSNKVPTSSTLWQRLRNLVMQLRRCSTHPYLIPGVAPEPNLIGQHVINTSGKFMVLEKLVRELVVSQGKKIIIFSNFTSVLDWCEDLLAFISNRGETFKHLRLDGSTAVARRNLNIRLFQNMNSGYQIMLVSTKAGGLGLNLTAATEVVFIDEDWNPQVDLQAEARAHRIGQTKPVTVYKLCSRGTVEEQMLGRIRKKLYLSAKVTEDMESIHATSNKDKKKRNGVSDSLEQEKAILGGTTQLKSLIRRGAQTLAHESISIDEMQSWDLETVLSRCREQSDDVAAEDDPEAEDKWLATMEKVESYVLDGQRLSRGQQEADSSVILPSSISRKDRRVGKNTTVMIDGFAISKDSIGCAEWEAVPTLAGKDPRLAEPKRAKKAAVVNQEVIQLSHEFEVKSGTVRVSSKCIGRSRYHVPC